MNNRDFDELAGRIEAVARMCLTLTAVLEDNRVIDGPHFSDGLRNSIQNKKGISPMLSAAQVTLHELAASLDGARSYRQSRGKLSESQENCVCLS